MENASKALLMAAGVLIGILILSLAVFLFANFGAASAEVHKQNEENRIEQFNAQFTAYQGRTDVTIYDVVTVANLAKSSNQSFGFKSYTERTDFNYYIVVTAWTLDGSKAYIESKSDEVIQNLIEYDLEHMQEKTDENGNKYLSLPTYNCDVTINKNTKRVSYVNFGVIKNR